MPVSLPTSPLKTIALPGRRNVTLIGDLGRGSAAAVYRGVLETDVPGVDRVALRASSPSIRRPVAVKLYDLGASDEPNGAVLELGRAAQRAANVVHPNAVQTFEMALVGRSHVAVVTELVEGTTLERLVRGHALRGRRMPLDLALFVTTEIAEALSGARMATTPEGVHAGMPHLDVAAHQVLLSFHGEVKLSDFGLAQLPAWGSGVRSRSMGGASRRWAAVAPEVAKGRPGDTRSDVFSLGILFREMLIGPRFGPEVSEVEAFEMARDGVVPPTFVELQLPADVSAILRRALEPDPARRYSHATALAYELRRVALSMGVGDGRMFLRTAISEQATTASVPPPPVEEVPGADRAAQRADSPSDPDTTDELCLDALDTPRLVADRTSGLILKADRARKRGA